MRRLYIYALAGLGLLLAGHAWAVNQNPIPGSVWTWYGPTFGADWSPMVGLVAFTPKGFGAIGDGLTNDTAAVQACLDAAADGGTCQILDKGRYYVPGGIAIPRATTLDCGWRSLVDYTPPMLAASDWGPALLLDPAHPITFTDTSGKIQNCTILPYGMVFPQTNATSWTGTAINTSARANPQIVNTTVVGFNICIDTTGSQRPYLVRLHLDCAGVGANLASLITGNNGDLATVQDVKLQVLGTATTCPGRLRAGTGLKLLGFALVDNLVVQDFQVAAINMQAVAQIVFGKVWIDFAVPDCARGSSVGVYMADVEDIDFGHLDIQGVQNGIQIVSQTNRSIHIHDLWLNAIGNDGIQMGASPNGGVLQIDYFRTNGASTIPGYAVNILDSTFNSHLTINGGTIYGVHGGVPPYIAAGVQKAQSFNISDKIVTDLAEPYKFYGSPSLTSCTGVGSGGCAFSNSFNTNPWAGNVIVSPTGGVPAASGEVAITWPMPFANTSGCVAAYKSGTAAWPALYPLQVVDQSFTNTKFVWNTSAPLTVGQQYHISFSCKPQ